MHLTSKSKQWRGAVLAAAMVLVLPAPAATAPKLAEAMSLDGLQQVKVKNIDLGYARPGASLAGYNSVQLERVVDRREVRSSGRLELASSVASASEAALIASTWARILRNGLDRAHGIGKK